MPEIDDESIRASLDRVLNRWAAVGLAVGVVRNGRLESFHGHGLADIASRAPVTEDTIFRIASVTKLFTAVAVLQLWERGLVDLDAPANDYLRAYQLIPAKAGFRPATLRHLLTHTAGIPEVVHLSDLFHSDWGSFGSRPAVFSVRVGETMPALADYYRGGLRQVVEPGSAFAYTNHGFATLGQIVEEMSGERLEAYLRAHIFEPLGMTDTDLVRPIQAGSRLATGYDLVPGGAKAVPDRDWITRGASGAYASTRDMAKFAAAILGGGSNDHGKILEPATLATMFEPHFQPDPRLPGIGLGFFRSQAGGHRVVGHEGVLPGFNAAFLVASDDGIALFACTNGSAGAMMWMPIELERLLRQLLGVPEDVVRTNVPHRPETWGELCGRYQLPGRVSDLRGRLAIGGGAEVFVHGGRLMVRLLTPVPALYRGLPLEPDDIHDPTLFRLDLTRFGMGIAHVAFGHGEGSGIPAIHTDVQMLSFYRRPRADRAWRSRALAAGVISAMAIAASRQRGTRRRHPSLGAA